jgi:ureidoglycolate hydrolase
MSTNHYNKLFKRVNSGKAENYWDAAQQEKSEQRKEINEEDTEKDD